MNHTLMNLHQTAVHYYIGYSENEAFGLISTTLIHTQLRLNEC